MTFSRAAILFTAALETCTLSGISERRITFCDAGAMSALPLKADMCSATRYVRFVPIADIPASQRDARLPVDIYRAGKGCCTMASTDLQKSTAA